MSSSLKDTVRKNGYPSVVLEVISEFLEIVTDVFENDEVGVLLVGSTSRGELCWQEYKGEVTLFSDIEFLIAVNSESRCQKKNLKKRVNELSLSYDLGERFHLDYVVNNWLKLQSLQKKIFIFDCKSTGVDLTEYKVKDHLPDVEKTNLDFKELNDVLLHRMKAVINDIPQNGIIGSDGHNNFILSIAKNTLDITTWLYPYEADELLSGFENRLDAWDAKKNEISLAGYFTKNDFDFLRLCLDIRKMPDKEYDEMELLSHFIKIYERAIEYCKFMNSISCDSDISEDVVSSKLFKEYNIKRRLAEMRNILKCHKLFSTSNIMLNIFYPRKGKQINFCFAMVKAFCENSRCVKEKSLCECENSINVARDELKALRKVECCGDEKFLDEWLSLRREYLTLNTIFI